MEIAKLIEERGKIHGDPTVTHGLAYDLNKMIDGHHSNRMTKASRAMFFMICVKVTRAIQRPDFGDNWDDIGGYAELIKRGETALHEVQSASAPEFL
jgi:hypothetical protein